MMVTAGHPQQPGWWQSVNGAVELFCHGVNFIAGISVHLSTTIMMNGWIYINGSFQSAAEARLHISDLAIQRGYAVFDFLKVVKGNACFVDDHLDRLYHSANAMHLAPIPSRETLKEIIQRLIRKNEIVDAGIRITVTGGASPDGYSLESPNVIIAQQDFAAPTPISFNKGIRLMTYKHQRQFPEIKTTDYLMAIWLQPMLAREGADDVLYVHDGAVTECPRANFFLITANKELVTAGECILKGITRSKIIQCALKAGYRFMERNIPVTELATAEAAFVSSTTKGILPVTNIDGRIMLSHQSSMIADLHTELKHLTLEAVGARMGAT